MFQLDDQFLNDLGLDKLPSEQRKAFLEHIYQELELRVGTKLSDGLSDAQLQEFESIIDKDDTVITNWVAQYAPNYQQDEMFTRLQQAANLDPASPELRNEYVATKWLEVNRPDYRDVVAATLADLKQEIMTNRDAILNSL